MTSSTCNHRAESIVSFRKVMEDDDREFVFDQIKFAFKCCLNRSFAFYFSHSSFHQHFRNSYDLLRTFFVQITKLLVRQVEIELNLISLFAFSQNFVIMRSYMGVINFQVISLLRMKCF